MVIVRWCRLEQRNDGGCSSRSDRLLLVQKTVPRVRIPLAPPRSLNCREIPLALRRNVRREIARVAGVGARSVSNVRAILQTAHPRLIEALQEGTLSINRAIHFCKLPRAEQVEQFIRYSEERATNKVIRRSIARPKEEKISPDVVTVLDALQHQEARQPGSVPVRVGRHKRTVVLIGQDLLVGPHSQKELKLK